MFDMNQDDGMPDVTGDITVAERLSAAGISPSRIELHLAAGRVTIDSVVTTDPDTPAPPPARITIHSA